MIHALRYYTLQQIISGAVEQISAINDDTRTPTMLRKDSSTACEQHSGKTPPFRVNSILERLLHFV